MNSIRKAFSDANKVDSGLFSYNSKGACETCGGTGTVELNLSFMDKTNMECSECNGTVINRRCSNMYIKEKI